ncbi:hypothetical protein DSM112329_02911 [Paraconexibacter sp. AEG42_29]|uniref:Uncharacterized protein n=1 Tax=Paraconexibacter sp. AEG42_29 TaxID=2997339 RepID=A0AAU7AWH8_9ACTN
MLRRVDHGVRLAAAVGLAAAPWLEWFNDGNGGALVRSVVGEAADGVTPPDPSTSLWEHSALAGVMLVCAAALALTGVSVRTRLRRTAAACTSIVIAMAALLLGRHVATVDVVYVLRGYGASVYGGVDNRQLVALPTVVVGLALSALAVVTVMDAAAGRALKRRGVDRRD